LLNDECDLSVIIIMITFRKKVYLNEIINEACKN
jgi:hypothetical protein